MRKLIAIPALIPFILLGSTASAQTHVWKVGGVSPHFTTLQAAVDAAHDGDLLLLRAGTYAAFQVHDKALSILPALGASVVISGESHVEDSGIGKLSLLGNLSCKSLTSVNTPALVLRNNLGTVVLRDATIQALTATFHAGDGWEGLRLDQSQKVIIDQCQVVGSGSTYLYGRGGPGIFASGFNLASFRTSYNGGPGWENPCDGWYWGYAGADGGPGANLWLGLMFAAGGGFHGADAGGGGDEHWDLFTWYYYPPGIGGTGGSGILLGSGSHAEEQFVSVTGGWGGGGCGAQGANGSPHQASGGSFSTLAGTPCEITLQSLAHENSLLAVTAKGTPGESVYLMTARRAIFSFDPALSGCRLVPQPTISNHLPIGVIPPSGVLVTQVLAVTLPPADETRTFIVQGMFVSPSGTARLSNGTAIALVDANINLN